MRTLQIIAQILATLSCGLFSGAAIYINFVEHPARMSCGIDLAASEWVPSYKRATLMQAPLAIFGFVFALIAWLAGANWWWFVGGLFFGFVVPFTFMFIMPTNRRLSSGEVKEYPEEARRLLEKWNRLHSVRTILSTIAFVIFLLNF